MSGNRFVLAQLNVMKNRIEKLPIDQIELLLEELAEMKSQVKKYEAQISSELSRRFADQAKAERRLQCKDTGTVRLACGDHVIVADLPKEVTWDQSELASIVCDIDKSCEDSTDYVTIKYSVDERKFTAWPKSIQASFVHARTVSTGKPTYKIESKKEAA